MHLDAVQQCPLQFGQGRCFVHGPGRVQGQGGPAAAVDNAALGDDQCLARQNPVNAVEYTTPAGGKLHLQQFVQGPVVQFAGPQPGTDQGRWFGGEGETEIAFDVVDRFDAKGITGQDQLPRGRIVDGNGIHATQLFGEIDAVAAVKMQGRLAIGPGLPGHRISFFVQGLAQFHIIIDLGIGDQRGPVGSLDRLVAGFQVDNGQTGMGQANALAQVLPHAIGAAMLQGALQGGEDVCVRGASVRRHDARDAAHQPATWLKNSKYLPTTTLSP